MTALQMEREPLAATVARRVRGLRAELGLTQAELGKAIGLSTASVSERLRGDTKFDINELPALASTLGVSMEYLLGLTDERRPRRTLPDETFDDLRARRDSNPKPSDLYPEGGRLIDLSAWRAQRTRTDRRQIVRVS